MTESYTSTIESKSKHQLINTNNIISFFIFLSLLNTPKNIQATTQESQNNIKSIFELNNTTNLLNQMNQKFGIILPKQYNENLQNFVSNSTTLHNEAAAKFTENFISEQMSKDRGISKENQYLFIRCAIYFVLTNGGELYNGTDGDEQRYNEYETAFDYFLECIENYKTKLKELMENEQQKAKDDAQKAKDDAQKAKDDAQKAKDDAQKAKDDAQKAKDDAQKAKDDAEKAKDDAQRAKDDAEKAKDDAQRAKDDAEKAKDDAMKADSIGLQELTNYYLKYKQNPSLAMPEEVNHVKSIAQDIFQSCEKYGIDIKQILSPEIRKFYGTE